VGCSVGTMVAEPVKYAGWQAWWVRDCTVWNKLWKDMERKGTFVGM
jgi:hypothetical protein